MKNILISLVFALVAFALPARADISNSNRVIFVQKVRSYRDYTFYIREAYLINRDYTLGYAEGLNMALSAFPYPLYSISLERVIVTTLNLLTYADPIRDSAVFDLYAGRLDALRAALELYNTYPQIGENNQPADGRDIP